MLVFRVTRLDFTKYLSDIFDGTIPYSLDAINEIYNYFDYDCDPLDIHYDVCNYSKEYILNNFIECSSYRELVKWIYNNPDRVLYYDDLPEKPDTENEEVCKKFCKQYWSFFSDWHKTFKKPGTILIKTQ